MPTQPPAPSCTTRPASASRSRPAARSSTPATTRRTSTPSSAGTPPFWPLGPTGFGIDYTQGENISGDGAEGTSYGIAAVQRIERYGIDLYSQFRWYELDDAAEPGLKNITVGTFGTKFTF